jgi:hypothetical protein
MSDDRRLPDREREALIEASVSAWRPRAPDGRILPHPSWADLSGEDRLHAFEETVRARALESLLDRVGLSTTARAILGRIGRAPG